MYGAYHHITLLSDVSVPGASSFLPFKSSRALFDEEGVEEEVVVSEEENANKPPPLVFDVVSTFVGPYMKPFSFSRGCHCLERREGGSRGALGFMRPFSLFCSSRDSDLSCLFRGYTHHHVITKQTS